MELPPLNLASTATSAAGPLTTSSLFDGSGFSVNYGNGVNQGAGAGIPAWVWAAAAAVGVLFWKQIKPST